MEISLLARNQPPFSRPPPRWCQPPETREKQDCRPEWAEDSCRRRGPRRRTSHAETRNTNVEIRNKLELKREITETPISLSPRRFILPFPLFRLFGFVSNFEIRISDFQPPRPPSSVLCHLSSALCQSPDFCPQSSVFRPPRSGNGPQISARRAKISGSACFNSPATNG
jgi:hypothetical protein